MWAYLAGNPGHSTLRGLGGAMPDWRTAGLACFTLPIVMAILCGCQTRNQAEQMLADMTGIAGGAPMNATWAPNGVRRYFFGGVRGLIQRKIGTPPVLTKGDIVYFSGNNAPYFAHVAIATGNGAEVLSFGHAAPAIAFATPQTIERLTIQQIANANGRLTACHFGNPPW
jgi:hypothetical protein